jgi:deoxycytidine triphosphate deaminase
MKHIMGPNSRSELSKVQEGDVQPNAVDVRVGQIFKIGSNDFIIDEEKKVHRDTKELFPNEDGYWVLEPGAYEAVMTNIIKVAEGEAGWVVVRSTLNRNGVFLTSGLYDSGYHGVLAACLHVTSGVMKMAKGTRLGQYVSYESEALHSYDGDYGLGKEYDKKY